MNKKGRNRQQERKKNICNIYTQKGRGRECVREDRQKKIWKIDFSEDTFYIEIRLNREKLRFDHSIVGNVFELLFGVA